MQFSIIPTLFATLLTVVSAGDLGDSWQVRGFRQKDCLGKQIFDSSLRPTESTLNCTRIPDLTITALGSFPKNGRLCAYENDKCTPGTSIINIPGGNITYGDCPVNQFNSIKVINSGAC
ncbi:MAG: hypothetical protein MMC23_001550 [Stictis urceolatum]|nr:hypothetical protein [Stictis urceolata]